MMPLNMKEKPMSKQVSFEAPTQAEVDRCIADAHLMRSDYISKSVKSGWAHLRGVFLQKSGHRKVSA